MTEVEVRLRELVNDALASSGRPALTDEVGPTTFLPDVLESATLAALIVLVEEEWGFEIEDDEIDPQRFETIRGLAGFVQEKSSR